MEKKFKFTDNPKMAKIIYAVIIAMLCVTAVIVGVVAANNRKDTPPVDTNPPVTDDGGSGDGGENTPTPAPEEKLTFNAPVAGKVFKEHNATIPVYSNTLEAWKIHTGVDIETEEGAPVFASAKGEVKEVRNDPLLGRTVVIMHENGMQTVYSNLSPEGLPKVGDKVNAGDKIGNVGNSAISEIADETHLHFEMLLNEVSVNPLDYLTEESKKSSLGMSE